MKSVPKLTKFFKKRKENTNSLSKSIALPKKRPKIITCQGFYYGNNSDLVPINAKYKKDDSLLSRIKFRIRRMESNLHIEQYLMESKSSDTGYIAISKFQKQTYPQLLKKHWHWLIGVSTTRHTIFGCKITFPN